MVSSFVRIASAVSAVAFFAINPVRADTVWNFGTPAGDQGQSHNYLGSDGTTLLNLQAFGPNGGTGTPGWAGTSVRKKRRRGRERCWAYE